MTDPQLYYGIYFRIGLAKYDGITMTDQIHQYHLQSHLNLHSIKLKIYEYNLSSQLQEQYLVSCKSKLKLGDIIEKQYLIYVKN